MRRRVSILCLVLLALSVLAVDGQGTKLIYRSPKDLAAESPQIVRGRVASVSSYWYAQHTKIFTEARMYAGETLTAEAEGIFISVNVGSLENALPPLPGEKR